MWPFYDSLVQEEHLTGRDRGWEPPFALQAEHHALTLFALHQQSQSQPMHVEGVGVGTAIRTLGVGDSARFSEGAVDRRFAQAATATSLTELAHHLRGLVSQLRGRGKARPLDYSQLVEDLRDWCWPQAQQRVRRRWGGQYHGWAQRAEASRESEPTATDPS
jgi:CRISPR system Cascade subunit CasB